MLGTWVLGAEIRRGPTGVVYRATDFADPSQLAAVKVLTHDLTRTPEFHERFPGEMLPLRQLNHPNVARLYTCCVQDGAAYCVSEFIDGIDLATRLKSGELPNPWCGWRAMVSLAVQVGRGLMHGHRQSTLHRGLKPSNVLLSDDSGVKLTDFGLAKVVGWSPQLTVADPFGGAGFLAPEVFTGQPYTRRSDLYAYGCVLYAAFTGRPPFTGDSLDELTHKHCYTLPIRPAELVPGMLIELDDLICALLEKDPNRRPPSAVAVLDMLGYIRGKADRRGKPVQWPAAPEREAMTAFTDDEPLTADAPTRWPYRRGWAVLLVVLTLVLSAVLLLLARLAQG